MLKQKGKLYRLDNNCPFLDMPYTGKNAPKALPPLDDNAIVLLLEFQDIRYEPIELDEEGYGKVNTWHKILWNETVGWTASRLEELHDK